MAVTKADLVETLFNQVGLNKREAKDFTNLFFGGICKSLESGAAVKLSGFGVFSLRDKAARPGRNPKTGEQVTVSARRVVTFRSSRSVRAAVSKNTRQLNQTLAQRRG